ncbi:MAG: helix-turn-helix domain-containing protein [Opitutaceae bacterium]|jgi:AraC-like DNA-binding protein|nr:helix-turn-helix domain-containing protein [Opitutaceae bacterium]
MKTPFFSAPPPATAAATAAATASPFPIAHYQDWTSLRQNLLWIYEGPVPAIRPGGAGESRGASSRSSRSSRPSRLVTTAPPTIGLDYCAAWLVTHGEAHVICNGKKVTATAGQWLIPWPGLREQYFEPGTQLLSARFQAHWPDGRALFDEGLSLVISSRDIPRLETAARHLLAVVSPWRPSPDPRLLHSAEIPLSPFVDIKVATLYFIRTYAETLIALGLKPTRLGACDERVLQALSQLDRFPLADKFREASFASKIGLGPRQLSRLFSTQMGMTPKQYIERRRHDICRHTLLHSSLPVKRLAAEFGFARHTDFSAWFKKANGHSPSRFRARYRYRDTDHV